MCVCGAVDTLTRSGLKQTGFYLVLKDLDFKTNQHDVCVCTSKNCTACTAAMNSQHSITQIGRFPCSKWYDCVPCRWMNDAKGDTLWAQSVFHAPPSAFRVEAPRNVTKRCALSRRWTGPRCAHGSHVRMNQPLAVFTAPSGPRPVVWKALTQPVSEMLATVASMLVSRSLLGGITPAQQPKKKK